MMPCIFHSFTLLYMLQPLTFVCGYRTLWFTLSGVCDVIISILTLQSCSMVYSCLLASMVFIKLLHGRTSNLKLIPIAVSFVASLQLVMICCRLLDPQLR
ncbi:hypothetical protein F4604DRAFT_1803975 [Suillus subluteus]|nr:hypothetical protein F4604DRAFT_1803973 [Suillus subluteus]KAG1853374.1 hypothetical protein F4604DRAFT_1803975 [Suillus subluteus]